MQNNFFGRTVIVFRLVMAALMSVTFLGSSDPVRAVAGLPDLVITNVIFYQDDGVTVINPGDEVNAGQTIQVEITVRNNGGDDYDLTPPTPDEIYRDIYIGAAPLAPQDGEPQGCHPTGRWAATDTTLPLSGQETTQRIDVTFNNSDAGEPALYFYVDVNCSIDETTVAEPAIGPEEANNSFGPLSLIVNATGCTPPSGGPQVFTDVPTNYWARDYIEALYYCGYTAGCSSSPLQYCPEKGMSRVESAVFILRGNYGSTYTTPDAPWDSFADNWTIGPWGEKWAEGLYQAGLTAGCATNPLRFCPWDQTPRLQLAVFAVRLRNGETFSPPPATGTVFADITDPNLWYAKWAEKAYADGLIPACGTQGGKPLFCPNTGATRALAAYAIAKAKNLVP